MKQSDHSSLSEQDWDNKLHIFTCGRDAAEEDDHHFPYEPTPYIVLGRLAVSGYIKRESRVLDYGCGKGRVCIFLSSECGCFATGIDFSDRMIRTAKENLVRSACRNLVRFQCCPAEQYEVTEEDTFFFFNPFTDTVLHSVIGRIRRSWYEKPRQIRLLCYYPSDEFVACLMTEPDLEFEDEIDCRDLFEGENPRERILIFTMKVN